MCPSLVLDSTCSDQRIFGKLSYTSYSTAAASLVPAIAGSSLLHAAILQRGAWMASVTFESNGAKSNYTAKPDGTVGSNGSGSQTTKFAGFVRVGSAVSVSFSISCSVCSNVSIVAAGAASSLSKSIASAFGPEYWYIEASANFSGLAAVSLSISSNGSPLRKVLSTEMHWLDDQVPSTQVLVQPGKACAAQSATAGATIATSGVPISFSISAFDDFYNPTNAAGRTWFMALHNHTVYGPLSDPLFSSVLVPVALASVSGASHYNRIVVTASGQYSISIYLVDRTGYRVDCFLNPHFYGAPFYSGFHTEAALPHSVQNVQAAVWSAHIVTPAESVAFVASGNVTARLYIAGTLVMNGNCSFSGCSGRWTPLLEGSIVTFKLEVSSSSDILVFNFKVSTSSLLLPNSLTLASFSSVAYASPFIAVFPAPPCAATSLLSGSGLVSATAGESALFQISPRDRFGNIADASAVNWLVRTRCTLSGAPANSCASRTSIVRMTVPGPGPSTGVLSGAFVPVSAQSSYLSVSLFDASNIAYGLFATVYADSHYSTILSSKQTTLSAAAPYLRSQFNVPANVSFSSALRGAVRVNQSSTCVVAASRAATAALAFAVQLSVFVQSEKVFEASGSSTATIAATGRFFASSDIRLYDIDVYYSETCSPSCSDTSSLLLSISCTSSSPPSTQNLQVLALPSIPQTGAFDAAAYPTVFPGAPCSSKSFVFGPGVSLATAGVANFFSIQINDAYSNPVDRSLSMSQLLSETAILCPTANLDANATMFSSIGSVVSVKYAPQTAGSHGYSIFISSASWLTGVVSVVSASASTRKSSVAYFSIATAGQLAQFSIVLRDDSGNIAIHSPSTALVCRLSAASASERHSVAALLIPTDPVLSSSPPLLPAVYTCAYRATTAGRYSASVLLASAGGVLASSSAVQSSLIFQDKSTTDFSSLAVYVQSQINRGSPLNTVFRFSGYVKPLVSGPHTFRISASPISAAVAAIRLWLDDEWVCDSRIGINSASVSLDAGVL